MKGWLPSLAGFGLLLGGWGQVGIVLPLHVSIASAATTHDLGTDWSDAANPNGVWTYREGTDALPFVPDWTILGSPVVQPAWAPSAVSGNFLPAWFKSRADMDPDLLTGDVVVHTTDPGNGGGSGGANVIWTSPGNGVVDISGAVWMVRDIDRSNTWTLLLNGVPLTSGTIFSGDAFDRANPFHFADGSGGPGALDDVPVSVNDVIELRIERNSLSGDFVGVKLTIALTDAADTLASLGPATLWIGLGNSDDQGTQFDIRTEVYINETLVGEGEGRCITGVTRNPAKAKEVSIEPDLFSPGTLAPGDEVTLRVLARIGTPPGPPDNPACSGHANAVGLRLYYDSVNRPARIGAEITPGPVTDLFLHSDGGPCRNRPAQDATVHVLDDVEPTATKSKCRDSAGLDLAQGNPWQEIGSWSLTRP